MEIKYIPVSICDGLPDRTPTVTQWDAGQVLRVLDSPFPAATEFLFKNSQSEELILSPAITHDGVTDAPIPNSLLASPYDITAYAVLRDGKSAKTVFSVLLDMQKRLPTEEFPTEEDDPVYVNEIAALIAAANETTAAAQAAAEKAENYAAEAQAIADTLSPADEHYKPESWVAQSGVAVKEAVWEALCNATDYTDEQLANRVIVGSSAPNENTIGDFKGQLYLDSAALRLYAFVGENAGKRIWAEIAFLPINAKDIPYENLMGEMINNVKDQLDFLDNQRIAQSFEIADFANAASSNSLAIEHECVKHRDICIEFDGESERAQSGIAVTEAISAAIKPRRYELIETITLEESAPEIQRDGLSLEDIFIEITWGASVSNGSLIADIHWKDKNIRSFRTFSVPAANAYSMIRSRSDGNLKTVEVTVANTNRGYISQNDAFLNANICLITDEKIEKIILTREFPAGTVIKIWGITA